jgi:hypothetical protein
MGDCNIVLYYPLILSASYLVISQLSEHREPRDLGMRKANHQSPPHHENGLGTQVPDRISKHGIRIPVKHKAR